MIIHQGNVRAYISFLYRRRRGEAAPEALLDTWGSLSNAEIDSQLIALYRSWGLSADNVTLQMEAFESFMRPPISSTAPEDTTAYQTRSNTSVLSTPKSSALLPLLSFIAIGILAGLSYAYLSTDHVVDTTATAHAPTELVAPSNSVSPDTAISAAAAVIDSNTSAVLVADTAVSSNHEGYKYVLERLINADQDQNIMEIDEIFSNTITQFYDKEYPSKQSVLRLYQDVWRKCVNRRYYGTSIQDLGNSEYLLSGKLEYLRVETQELKTISYSNIYTLDEENRIVKIVHAAPAADTVKK
jgi:hypothetical protein